MLGCFSLHWYSRRGTWWGSITYGFPLCCLLFLFWNSGSAWFLASSSVYMCVCVVCVFNVPSLCLHTVWYQETCHPRRWSSGKVIHRHLTTLPVPISSCLHPSSPLLHELFSLPYTSATCVCIVETVFISNRSLVILLHRAQRLMFFYSRILFGGDLGWVECITTFSN